MKIERISYQHFPHSSSVRVVLKTGKFRTAPTVVVLQRCQSQLSLPGVLPALRFGSGEQPVPEFKVRLCVAL